MRVLVIGEEVSANLGLEPVAALPSHLDGAFPSRLHGPGEDGLWTCFDDLRITISVG